MIKAIGSGVRGMVKNSKHETLVIDGKVALRIPLTKGFFAIIDVDDYDIVKLKSWTALPVKGRSGHYASAYGGRDVNGKRFRVAMHRFLCQPDVGMEVDHVNGNTLDNRRSNLRACTHKNNMRNMRRTKKLSSRFKGVSFFKRDSCWRAYIVVDARQKHLGYFECEEEAAETYDAAAERLFGEFASLNFPKEE